MLRDEFYTIKDVASIFGVSERTLKNYEKDGKIPEARRSSAGWRIYTEGDIAKLRVLFGDLLKGRGKNG